jgi:glutathione synthase/RimK-type ligase-like ATP-grasp enzyme
MCQMQVLDATYQPSYGARMMKIAYLASKVTLPGSPLRRSDAFEHDYMMEALRGPFGAQEMSVEDVDWNDQTIDWSQFDAALIGTTWDYWDQPQLFLSTLEKIEGQTRLFNSAATVRWNSDKRYLKELAAKGALTIPTLWIDKVEAADFHAAFDKLGSDDLVFKRQIGAGADGQFRLAPGDDLPDMPHPMMVQPFLSTIQEEGEYSFIFIDGEFSHALLKQAKSGDYRIQSTYGGWETKVSPSTDDLNDARAILDLMEETPFYARVDMIRDTDRRLLLMELELIEPYLYPKEGPELGAIMAKALKARLG